MDCPKLWLCLFALFAVLSIAELASPNLEGNPRFNIIDDHQGHATPKENMLTLFNERRCRRHELFIDFAQNEGRRNVTNQIIAPPGYFPYYCAGDCGHVVKARMCNKKRNVTNHAIMMNTFMGTYGRVLPAHPCCVPTKFSGLSLLFENWTLKSYPNMIVEECGCQPYI